MKNDKNYIGTFSKNNVPILKNNQSTIVNLANSNDTGTHWIAMKYINKTLFYFDSYAIPYIPDIIKNQGTYVQSTAYKNEITITLSNALEENYCNIIWYSNQ